MPEVRLKDVLCASAVGVEYILLDEAVANGVLDAKSAAAIKVIQPIVTGLVNKLAPVGKDITYVLTIASLPEAERIAYHVVKKHLRKKGAPSTGVIYTSPQSQLPVFERKEITVVK